MKLENKLFPVAPSLTGRSHLMFNLLKQLLNGARIENGAVIKAYLEKPKQRKVRSEKSGDNVEQGRTLSVRGFDKNTQEAELMEKFGVFGEIESVKIVSSREYAFVCFHTYDSAEKARQWSYLVESERLHCEIAYRRGKVIKEYPFQPLPFG